MIVETDFLDHWKTQMLIGVLGDPASPCYLLRLWAHCQTRKQYRFDSGKLTPAILKAITRAPADKQVFWDALLEVGFLDLHDDGTVEAHGFYDANSQLIANWKNGKKGGRPKKKSEPEKPIQNPTETHREPIEERERGEEKEEVEKQDEGERRDESSFSPSPCEKAFWIGKSYGNIEQQTIEDYGQLNAMDDPIEAAMAVTGDYSMGMYGFLSEGLQKVAGSGLIPRQHFHLAVSGGGKSVRGNQDRGTAAREVRCIRFYCPDAGAVCHHRPTHEKGGLASVRFTFTYSQVKVCLPHDRSREKSDSDNRKARGAGQNPRHTRKRSTFRHALQNAR